jgi:hypothetical protein
VPDSVQRTLAAEVAAEYPHPALLDVGHTTTLIRLVLDSAVLADSGGAAAVRPGELRAARPDPFREWESAWLQHIDGDRTEMMAALARHLPVRLRGGSVHPLAIDRYGITLRVEGPDTDHDVRLPFAGPVDDARSLSRALRILAGCPFLNHLRRR